jgi:small-conductance mechanosensitive channel
MFQQLYHQLRPSIFLSPWIIGPIVCVLWVVILLSAKKRILSSARLYLSKRATLVWVETLIHALSPTLTLVILAGGIALLNRILPLSSRSDRVFDVALAATLIAALITFTDRVVRRAVDRLAQQSSALRGALGLLQGGVRGVIVGMGVLIFLETIGISITPLIASLGIGTFAVALALQDTLANLFAGVYMIAEKPVEAGHFIKLESGEQGHVMRVGWRSTRIRMLSDTMVVVPNSKLAGSVITNFSLPQQQLAVTIEVGVDYTSDLQRVEEVTLEVARELMSQAEGAICDFEPRMRYHTFADSSINFTVWLGARDFVFGIAIKHEFIKRLHNRYRSEEILLPFPTRTVELATDTVVKLRGAMASLQKSEPNSDKRSLPEDV